MIKTRAASKKREASLGSAVTWLGGSRAEDRKVRSQEDGEGKKGETEERQMGVKFGC